MRKIFVTGIVIVLLLPFFSVSSLAYTFSNNPAVSSEEKSSQKEEDIYYENIINKYPEYKYLVDRFYPDHTAWVIQLVEKYGIAPLLAMAEVTEQEYAGLFRNADVFYDIFSTLSGVVHSESQRARLAIKLTNAFLLSDPEKDYMEAFAKAQKQDRDASLRGQPSRSYTERFFSQGLFPDNLWEEIKKSPEEYSTLLNMLSKADVDVLETFAQYPNTAAFLLNVGRDGVDLIEQTGGEIITLSYILSPEDQRKITSVFKAYPLLAKAVALCGPEAYFVISICPDFYFSLASALSGSEESRLLVAYAVFSKQLESAGEGRDIKDFLDNLSLNEKERLAFFVAGMLERMEYNESDDSAPLPIAPLVDPSFLKFVWRYGDAAVEVSTRFGDLLPIGTLLMKEWKGEFRDISPVVEAIRDFGEMGLQAALMFRFNGKIQDLVLGPLPGNRQRDALMFLFYNEVMDTQRTSNWDTLLSYMLDNYHTEDATGKPLKSDGTSIVTFLPLYDSSRLVYDAVVYGKSPSAGDVFFSALDLLDVIPLCFGVVGAGTVVKDIAKKGLKSSVFKYAKNYLKKFPKIVMEASAHMKDDVVRILSNNMDDALDALRKIPVKDLRRSGRSIVSAIQTASSGLYRKIDIWAMLSLYTPDIGDLKAILPRIGKLAKTTGYVIKNIFENTRHAFTGLFSRPWMVRHATEALLSAVVIETVFMPTIQYYGVMGISDLLSDQQQSQE